MARNLAGTPLGKPEGTWQNRELPHFQQNEESREFDPALVGAMPFGDAPQLARSPWSSSSHTHGSAANFARDFEDLRTNKSQNSHFRAICAAPGRQIESSVSVGMSSLGSERAASNTRVSPHRPSSSGLDHASKDFEQMRAEIQTAKARAEQLQMQNDDLRARLNKLEQLYEKSSELQHSFSSRGRSHILNRDSSSEKPWQFPAQRLSGAELQNSRSNAQVCVQRGCPSSPVITPAGTPADQKPVLQDSSRRPKSRLRGVQTNLSSPSGAGSKINNGSAIGHAQRDFLPRHTTTPSVATVRSTTRQQNEPRGAFSPRPTGSVTNVKKMSTAEREIRQCAAEKRSRAVKKYEALLAKNPPYEYIVKAEAKLHRFLAKLERKLKIAAERGWKMSDPSLVTPPFPSPEAEVTDRRHVSRRPRRRLVVQSPKPSTAVTTTPADRALRDEVEMLRSRLRQVQQITPAVPSLFVPPTQSTGKAPSMSLLRQVDPVSISKHLEKFEDFKIEAQQWNTCSPYKVVVMKPQAYISLDAMRKISQFLLEPVHVRTRIGSDPDVERVTQYVYGTNSLHKQLLRQDPLVEIAKLRVQKSAGTTQHQRIMQFAEDYAKLQRRFDPQIWNGTKKKKIVKVLRPLLRPAAFRTIVKNAEDKGIHPATGRFDQRWREAKRSPTLFLNLALMSAVALDTLVAVGSAPVPSWNSPTAANSGPKSKDIFCEDFQLGTCAKGNACSFKHNKAPPGWVPEGWVGRWPPNPGTC